MKKLKMSRAVTLTFEEGCDKYLENCRQRNLQPHGWQLPQAVEMTCCSYYRRGEQVILDL